MSESQSELLARVRTALTTAVLEAPPERAAAARAPADRQGRLAAFVHESAAVGCVVHGPIPAGEAVPAVVSILRGIGARKLLSWDADELPAHGLIEEVAGQGFEFLDARLPAEREGRRACLAQLDAADVGLTGALAGLADTGSLVLASGPSRPRLAWLLPPVHVALLTVDRLFADLAAFLEGARDAARESANLVFVTGPSRTGDIELILTRGVHGPRAVHVVLIG